MSADPVQLLDRLQPPEGWSASTDLDADPVAAEILDRVFADTGSVTSLDARRRRRIAGAVVVGALAAGGAVAALWDRGADETRRIACWSEAADPPESQVGLSWDGVSDPAALCATEWSAGRLGVPAPPGELQVCVSANGVAVVIPGDTEVCESLGLPEFALEPDDTRAAINEAQRELDLLLFPTNDCVPPEPAAAEVDRVLEKHGLVGWTITIDGSFSAAEPCASVALDPESTTAFVRPVIRPG